jgi:hypothetical protein
MIFFELDKKYSVGWVMDLEAGGCWAFRSTNPCSHQEILRKNTLSGSENGRQPGCGVRPVSIKSYDRRKDVTQRELVVPDSRILQYMTWQLIKSLQTCYILLPFLNDLQFAILAFLRRLQHFLVMHLSTHRINLVTEVLTHQSWCLSSGPFVGGQHNAQTIFVKVFS